MKRCKTGPSRLVRGFTLLEVIVALSILAISLTVLLASQATSLSNAGRSRDLSIATLLARSKMVDVEQQLFHEGFVENEQSDKGTFKKEGYPDIRWTTRVSAVELDLTNLMGMCEGVAKKHGDGDGGGEAAGRGGADGKENDCSSMMQSVGVGLGGLMSEVGRSMRAVEVTVMWPVGRFHEHMGLRAIVTRDDFQTLQEGDAARNAQRLEGMQGAAGLPTSIPTTQAVP